MIIATEARTLTALLLFLISGGAIAQSALLDHEYASKVQGARTITPLSDQMFGDVTSGATGSTTFENIDIDLPGNNALPVRLGRRIDIKERFVPEELGGLGNWDIDVPYIEGTFTEQAGWTVGPASDPDRHKRCSNPGRPHVGMAKFSANEVWHGYNVHIPGAADEQLLVNANALPNPTTGGPYPWTLKSMGRVSCLSQLKEGAAGEGFLLVRPDGTRYFFDLMVERQARRLLKGPSSVPGFSVDRKRIFMLATRVEDRFGNFVNFNYTAGRLSSVSASDGRLISITYPNPSAIVAQADGRTWTYALSNGHLQSVTNPDGSQWTYSPFGSIAPYSIAADEPGLGGMAEFDPATMCNRWAQPRMAAASFTVTHPSGAQATFQLESKRFFRSNVKYNCIIDFFESNAWLLTGHTNYTATSTFPNQPRTTTDWGQVALQAHAQFGTPGQGDWDALQPPNLGGVIENYTSTYLVTAPTYQDVGVSGHAHVEIPNNYEVLALKSKVVSGPGLAPATTSYAYELRLFTYCDRYNPLTNQVVGSACTVVCANGNCEDTAGRWTKITLPSGNAIRLTHGVVYGKNEGVLLKEEILDSAGVVKRTTTHQMVPEIDGAPQNYAAVVGGSLTIDPMPARIRPLAGRVISQDGASFSRIVAVCGDRLCFDALARPTSVVASSSLGYSRTEGTEYHDDLQAWVLGQSARQLVNGAEVARVDYAANALPWKFWEHGRVKQTLAYNTDGTLDSVTNGRGYATTLSQWTRGIPKLIAYPDGTTVSATLNQSGWITSTTDQLGQTTSYSHDALGRISQVAYPASAATPWEPTSLTFERLTSPGLGLPAGVWRQRVETGGHRVHTYLDALWRPMVRHEFDAANATETSRYQAWLYDSEGRVSFAAYPRAAMSSLSSFEDGVWNEHDALGRVTSSTQDSELGPLVTLSSYLDGFRVRTTNPLGHHTTTSFMAFDGPDTSLPMVIEAPENITTTMVRNALGQTTMLTRSGAWGGSPTSLSQYYIYDAHHRLCKAIIFEKGATHYEYDENDNPVRVADGDYTYTQDVCNSQSIPLAEKSTRTYDAMDRLLAVAYPDGTSDTVFSYGANGQLLSVVDDDTSWQYEYDNRNNITRELLQASAGVYEYRWSYNALGHLASRLSITGNGNPLIDFAPNALGQPTQAGVYATNAKYHPNGALKSFTYGNGIQRTITLNERQLPARVHDALQGVSRHDDSFAYDANANPVAITDALGHAGSTRTMAYDAMDRLTYANIPGHGASTWAYDPLDNIRSVTTAPTGGTAYTRSYLYDGSNRLTSITQDGATWGVGTYDARGNLIDRNGQTLNFDRASRLTGIPGVANYEYDGHGRRTAQWRADGTVRVSLYTLDGRLQGEADNRAVGSTDYIYLGGTLVAKRFQHWSGTPPVVTYLHSDGLGSPVLETDASGAVLSRERFLSYGGAVDGAVKDAVGYTGHQEDPASGLVYMQQRYYDPAIGRFLSVDPILSDTQSGWNFNRYNYASNSPYKFHDPDGRAARKVDRDYITRALGNKPFWDLEDGFEATLDANFNEHGQASYEFHIYKDGREVGTFKRGGFVTKHGKSAAPPAGFEDRNLGKLRGLDNYVLAVRGELKVSPERERRLAFNAKSMRTVARFLGWAGIAVLAVDVAKGDMSPSEAMGITEMGCSSTIPCGGYVPDVSDAEVRKD